MKMFALLLKHLITIGTLEVTGPDGRRWRFEGAQPGPSAAMRVHDRRTARRLFLNPRIALGEGFMEGTITIEEGDICGLLLLLALNIENAPPHPMRPLYSGFGTMFRRVQQWNPLPTAQRNVAHHYDLSAELYELFLDADRQYSCAYFARPDDDLETAQLRKKRHIASKLRIDPGMRVLDIGCGWGGLALFLAEECGADVTGLTLSVEQLKVAEERAAAAGLSDRVRFHLRDYRLETGSYDRIVSVGMFEHVGINHYAEYFEAVHRLLKPDGVALVHAIGRSDGPGATNPWIRKYIFPGGYSPALSEVLPVVEKARLWATDIEILRLHYAETLKAWRQRFMARRAEAARLYDERFCRMWEFYLAGCEVTFRVWGHMVWQLQLTRDVGTLPITRDYMLDWERANAARHEGARTDAAERGKAGRAA